MRLRRGAHAVAAAAALLFAAAACSGNGPASGPVTAGPGTPLPAPSTAGAPATPGGPVVASPPAAAPSPSGVPAAVADLLQHVPGMFRDTCVPDPDADDPGAIAAVTCVNAGPTESIEYIQFESVDEMNAAYQARLAAEQPPDLQDDCDTYASEQPWTDSGDHSGNPSGRLACYPAPGPEGTKEFMWTDDSVVILSVTLAQGDYPQIYGWWNAAEPGPLR